MPTSPAQINDPLAVVSHVVVSHYRLPQRRTQGATLGYRVTNARRRAVRNAYRTMRRNGIGSWQARNIVVELVGAGAFGELVR